MSRATEKNEKYTLAFGVDHTPMSCFFQLYEKAAKGETGDEDGPQISADEQFGLEINNRNTLSRNQRLARIINRMETEGTGILRTEETIIEIGKALGLDVTKKVFELWD